MLKAEHDKLNESFKDLIQPMLHHLGEAIWERKLMFGTEVPQDKADILHGLLALLFSKIPDSFVVNPNLDMPVPSSSSPKGSSGSADQHDRDHNDPVYCGNGVFVRTVDPEAGSVDHGYIKRVLRHVEEVLCGLNPVSPRNKQIDDLKQQLRLEKKKNKELETKLAQGTKADPLDLSGNDIKPRIAKVPTAIATTIVVAGNPVLPASAREPAPGPAPSPGTPAPATPAPAPSPGTPAPATPAPTPSPGTPAPATPAPTPSPATPAPATPAPTPSP